MRGTWVDWSGAHETARSLREWFESLERPIDVSAIEADVVARGDEAVLELTARFDATDVMPSTLRVHREEATAALEEIGPRLRGALETAAANIEGVARAQVSDDPIVVRLPQGQTVALRDVAVASAGIYAPGGRAAYPSSVLMGGIVARAAGVPRVVLASPPGPNGNLHPAVLAAAALCEVDEIFAMGGAQAVFALAHGTETVDPVDVIAGPGSRWVTEAKRAVYGRVGIDSLAGPSELMVVLDGRVNLEWIALDLCAQAEHGGDSPLLAVATDRATLEDLAEAVEQCPKGWPTVKDAPFALIEVPGLPEAAELANAFAPEHLELAGEGAEDLAGRITTAGCVFVGESSATAFGDYAAGSNHVLPTAGAGRFAGPLGPGTFRRRIANVEVPPEAAAILAPTVDVIATAEGLPMHGASALARNPGDKAESEQP